MAVARKKSEFDPVTEFDDWYKDPRITDPRTGALGHFALAECANNMWKKFEDYKREHLGRTQNSEMISTFGVFWTTYRAIRRTIPAMSPEDTLGRSGFWETTSASAIVSYFS